MPSRSVRDVASSLSFNLFENDTIMEGMAELTAAFKGVGFTSAEQLIMLFAIIRIVVVPTTSAAFAVSSTTLGVIFKSGLLPPGLATLSSFNPAWSSLSHLLPFVWPHLRHGSLQNLASFIESILSLKESRYFLHCPSMRVAKKARLNVWLSQNDRKGKLFSVWSMGRAKRSIMR